ncbi:hypothetical protein JOL62DRAFT_499980 [Phyllosticta paracitricarpa]|uniref:Uncharacterized protein n=1 Tax=Phyllosticta paracitricarpa TaxID=2016321 RepID=A0ABR1NA25_9PEZI
MVGAPSFSSPEYWESRFRKDPSAFEWLLSPNCLDKHVLEALAAASSPSPDCSSSPSLPLPCVHHIGCGTSAMSFQLRRLVDDPAQVHNTDYSPAAVEIGRNREREMFGDGEGGEDSATRRYDSASTGSPSSERMRWSTIDLLSLRAIAPLAHPHPPYAVIVDKSTSDCISCVDDVTITLPYALQPVETDSTSAAATAAAKPQTTAKIHPLHLLAVHLAHHTRPGGRWLAVSYSGARFPFVPPYPERADEGRLDAEMLERGFVHPGRLWRLERREMVGAEVQEGEKGEGEGGGNEGAAQVVHRPRIVHFLYVLVRTDLRLEMVGGVEKEEEKKDRGDGGVERA